MYAEFLKARREHAECPESGLGVCNGNNHAIAFMQFNMKVI